MLKAGREVDAKAGVRGRSFGCALCLDVLSLAGCESLSGILGSTAENQLLQTAEKTDHTQRPIFGVGDRYRFDNPEITWEVTAVHGERVYWRSAGGDEQVTSTNPLLLTFAWQSARRGSGQRIISNQAGDIFPLKVGARMTFRSTVSTDKPPFGWEFEWSCDVVGKERVTVPAGEFDSFRVQCGRQGSRELSFYYVPEIGHYARMEAIGPDGKKTATRNLIAYEHGETSVSSLDTNLASAEIVSPIKKSGGIYDPPITTGTQTQPIDASVTLRTPNFAVEKSQPASVAGIQKSALVKKIDIAKLPTFGLEQTRPNPSTSSSTGQGQISAPAVGKLTPAITTMKPLPKNSVSTTKPKSLAALRTADHSVIIHLASYRDSSAARRGWLALRRKYDPLFDGLDPEIQRVELKGKGTYYRLYAAALPSRSVAQNICEQLKKRGGWCAVSSR